MRKPYKILSKNSCLTYPVNSAGCLASKIYQSLYSSDLSGKCMASILLKMSYIKIPPFNFSRFFRPSVTKIMGVIIGKLSYLDNFVFLSPSPS